GGRDAHEAAFAALRELLLETHPRPPEAPHAGEPDAFTGWRIRTVLAGGLDAQGEPPSHAAGPRRLYSMPPHERRSFVAHRFVRRGLRRSIERAPARAGAEPLAPAVPPPASQRRP